MFEFNDAPLDTLLYGVYGPECFPTVFACKINEIGGRRAIWGYSVYHRSPGFSTLGQNETWALAHSLKLFSSLDDAYNHISQLIIPKKSALSKLKKA